RSHEFVESGCVTRLRLSQLAFPRNALMLFVCTFDAIFELAPIVRELFGHLVDPAWHIATDCGPEGHALTDMEFMRGHRGPLSSRPNRVLTGLAHRRTARAPTAGDSKPAAGTCHDARG